MLDLVRGRVLFLLDFVMTIAVSVVVKPSNLLAWLLAALCFCAASVGVGLGLGLVADLSMWTRGFSLLACVVLAIFGFVLAQRRRKTYHIDISGAGQIRLRAIARHSDDRVNSDNVPHGGGMLVTLLADSTLWPRFLMLRLQDDDRRVHVLPILPDSLPVESFRALGVACRWIAAHRFSELN